MLLQESYQGREGASGHSDWLTTTTMQRELDGRFTIRAILLFNIIDLKMLLVVLCSISRDNSKY
jgi:hypothetical protein